MIFLTTVNKLDLDDGEYKIYSSIRVYENSFESAKYWCDTHGFKDVTVVGKLLYEMDYDDRNDITEYGTDLKGLKQLIHGFRFSFN